MLIDCVQDAMKCDKPIAAFGIECTKLNSRMPSLYCSYHVSVKVDAVDLKGAIDLLMEPSVRPRGILVKRYLKPKNVSAE